MVPGQCPQADSGRGTLEPLTEGGTVDRTAERVDENQVGGRGEIVAARKSLQRAGGGVRHRDAAYLPRLRGGDRVRRPCAADSQCRAVPVDVGPAKLEQFALAQAAVRRDPDSLAILGILGPFM